MKSDAALFIDADNISPSLVEEALRQLRKDGAAVSVRRAYGGHEKLGGMKDVLRRHGFRAFVNHGKGTTDVALAVDAMDLLHGDRLPGTVVIGSSDADFAALVVRLREAGIRVVCFAHRMAADADALHRVYDEVVFVDVATAESPVPTSSTSPAPAKSVPKAAPISAPAMAAPVAPEDGEMVRRILAALPEWRPDTVKQLNQLGEPLRAKNIKTGSKPLHEMFRKHPAYFKVMPTTGPAKQVKLLKKPL